MRNVPGERSPGSWRYSVAGGNGSVPRRLRDSIQIAQPGLDCGSLLPCTAERYQIRLLLRGGKADQH